MNPTQQGTPLDSSLPKARSGALPLARSEALLAEARALVPGVTHSMMKRPEQFALGSYPVYLAGGQGALVWDVDGSQYIDFISGLGATTLGHNHPQIVAALQEQLPHGILYSLPGEIEVHAARELVQMIPHAQMARFFKTGADATSAAVRLARHVTGREHVVTVGYNGWHDHFMFDTPGVPAALRSYTTRMPLQSESDEAPLLSLVNERGSELALVLLSLPYNRVVSRVFLHALRAACSQHGVLLVLDEVVTGFRLARGGAQELYDVRADFVCLSKGIAAGMPLSAVAGPREILSRMGELQVSTTFGGELLSMAACRAALRVYRETDYIAHIAALGRQLKDGINQVATRGGHALRIVGYDAIPFFRFADTMQEQARLAEPFVGAMARRGVLLRRDVNFLSGAHTQAQIQFTIEATRDALQELASQRVSVLPKTGAREVQP